MKNVVIYYSDTCPHCREAEAFMDEKGIPYEGRNIKEPQYRNELIKMGFRSVPVIQVDGESILGFNKEELEAKLD